MDQVFRYTKTNSDKYREIGTGSQGIVFQGPESIDCFKFKLNAHSPALWNNYIQQKKITEAFSEAAKAGIRVGVLCPEAKAWITPSSTFWDHAAEKFDWPTNARNMAGKTHSGFAMERIFPVPESVRNGLIEKYCEEEYREIVSNDIRNQDCLIRVYLGISEPPRANKRFRLRNFPMDIHNVEAAGLPGHEYAHAMAAALAVLHWQAKLDADDVEFVLGGPPVVTTRVDLSLENVDNMEPETDTWSLVQGHHDFRGRTMMLWVLDFDRCKDITMDQEGVDTAVQAMERNGYCPRTGSGNEYQEGLWKIFRERYLEVSKKLLSDNLGYLADSFIDGFKAMCAERLKRQAEYDE